MPSRVQLAAPARRNGERHGQRVERRHRRRDTKQRADLVGRDPQLLPWRRRARADRRPRAAGAPTSAGTVSVTRPFAALVAATLPRSGSHEADGVEVWTVTRAASSPALKTARYSRRASRSIRLTARRLCCATRTNDPPVDKRRMRITKRSERTKMLGDRMADDVERRAGPDRRRPDPLLRLPLVDLVGNMSWRAALSPPRPIIPTSSP